MPKRALNLIAPKDGLKYSGSKEFAVYYVFTYYIFALNKPYKTDLY
jgi:hypothetical protein